MPKWRQLTRYAWASPATALGLTAACLTGVSGGSVRVHHGIIEAHGGFAKWFLRRGVPLAGGAAAMTLGHVVIAVDQRALDQTRHHERVHVRQYERWGPVFIPAYFLASAWLKFQGRNAYFENPFEKKAHAADDARRRQKK